MNLRIRASAILFFAALLTESRAFAAGGGRTSLIRPDRHHKHQLDAIGIINGDSYHSNNPLDNAMRRRKAYSTTRRALTRLRAGAAGSSSDTIPPPSPPTNLALFKFYFPCLALWISGPLLSLVDTSFVGLSAKAGAVGGAGSAAQLAALGPATTFIDGSLYLFAFLNVATTNLYASALARGESEKRNKDGNDEKPGEGVVRTAAKTSLYSGIGLMALLLAVARPLIALYIGEFT